MENKSQVTSLIHPITHSLTHPYTHPPTQFINTPPASRII